MPKLTKPAAKKPAAPTKAPAKKATKPAAAKSAKPAEAKAPAKAAVAVKTKASAKQPAASRKPAIPAEQRRNYVEVAAYYIAERHGFTPGRELADWSAAEAEIDRLLATGKLNP